MKRICAVLLACAMLCISACWVALSEGKVLKKGSRGDEVRLLQERLFAYGFTAEKPDGIFGPKTEAAVKALEIYLYDIEREVVTRSIWNDAITLEQLILQDASTPISTLEVNDDESTIDEWPYPEIYDGGDGEVGEDASAPESEDVKDESAETEDAFEPSGIVDERLRALVLENGFQVYRRDLTYEDTGAEVKRLKARLRTLGFLDGIADGEYGTETIAAVAGFQAENNLTRTGRADRDTQFALYSTDAAYASAPAYPFYLTIDIDRQRVSAYKWVEGEYTELVREMRCSTGLDRTPTPKGSFISEGPCARWCYFPSYGCWAQYAFRIEGSILFHSVLYDEAREDTLRKGSVANLGRKASHGCVRLSLEDAKWIYDNCKKGTTVEVF